MEQQTKRKDYVWMRKAFVLLFFDVISIMASYMAALLLRFDLIFSNIPRGYLTGYIWSMPYWVIISIVVFYGMRLYHSIWMFAGIDEAKRIVQSYMILLVFYGVGIFAMDLRMPRSYFLVGYVFSIMCTVGLRFGYRLLRSYLRSTRASVEAATDRVMIIGAGQAGKTLILEMQNSRHMKTKVCCVIDDNPNKKGRLLEGVPIVGNRYDIEEMVQEYGITRIVYAIPAASADDRKAILNICKQTGCKLQTVPGIYQLLNEEVSVSRLRDVEITDLLGRAQVKVNNSEILQTLSDKVILVTGGGGSIGSELCRQIAASSPKMLIIFDIYENNAYTIQQELKRLYPDMKLITLIGSVRNTRRIDTVIETYRPDIIFHAAAHKHVPLMEDSPNEAIKNNVEGTYKTALAAAKHGVKKFVLISTDKAVNPTNIMGASKRLCEMIIQMMDRHSDTDFVAVRFGNVLGSNGSVIPLFKKQIAEGGPVTVTDKRMIRYFMTIPEAVSLILQASYYAHGGEIFVLDMGEPVKIDDMARNLIRLSGYVPDEDIKIVYTGLRPGEKLYEELLMDEEGITETENELIFIGKPIKMDDADFMKK
ncbi:MAG TPA: polysaccharide biosynthesis protein, partial [Candidatus Mediterraneibacter pullicola]|nr:polysaccharide biosynthesis protein [Candidatus Mediterraneibacter pullicola]